jgi:hypothetical protein
MTVPRATLFAQSPQNSCKPLQQNSYSKPIPASRRIELIHRGRLHALHTVATAPAGEAMSTCKFVLLASSLGRNLANEAHDIAPFLFPHSHVAKPLLRCAGKPLLTIWLRQLLECPRLACKNSIGIVVLSSLVSPSFSSAHEI